MKKIIIFTSRGGGGHLSVSNALEAHLKNKYIVQQECIFSDVLGRIDPLHFLSRGRYSGVDLYNWFMRKRIYWTLNVMAQFGLWLYSFLGKHVERKLKIFLEKEHPDVIISAVPIVNNAIIKVAQQLDIPLIIIPTDLNLRTFINGINAPNYDKLYFTIPFKNKFILKTLEPANIPEKNIHVTGFVIRPAFFKQYDIAEIKKDFSIPLGKPVAMILMGAVGSNVAVDFAKELSSVTKPLHLIVCTGRNEAMQEQLQALQLPEHISLSIIGYTNRIAELMKVSDIFITKSGTVSFCEGMYMNVPMLLDATSTVLKWEQINHTITEQKGFGYSVKSYAHAKNIVQNLLDNPKQIEKMRAILDHPKKIGYQEIEKLINKILN